MSTILEYVKQALNDDSGSYFTDSEYTNYILTRVDPDVCTLTLYRVGPYDGSAGAWYIQDCFPKKPLYAMSAESGTSGTVVEYNGSFSGTFSADSSTLQVSGSRVDVDAVLYDVLMDISVDNAKCMVYQEMNGLTTDLQQTAKLIRHEAQSRLGARTHVGVAPVVGENDIRFRRKGLGEDHTWEIG